MVIKLLSLTPESDSALAVSSSRGIFGSHSDGNLVNGTEAGRSDLLIVCRRHGRGGRGGLLGDRRVGRRGHGRQERGCLWRSRRVVIRTWWWRSHFSGGWWRSHFSGGRFGVGRVGGTLSRNGLEWSSVSRDRIGSRSRGVSNELSKAGQGSLRGGHRLANRRAGVGSQVGGRNVLDSNDMIRGGRSGSGSGTLGRSSFYSGSVPVHR